MLRSALVLLVLLTSAPVSAEVIEFQCTWNDEKPLIIRVDTTTKKATREDGGKTYTVIKVTKWAVWLMVDEPANQVGLALQMIQRRGAVIPNDAPAGWSGSGKWVDLVMSLNGTVSTIDGGRCWER